MKPCRVDGCDRRVRSQGLCFGHVRRGEDAEVAPRFPAEIRDAEGRKRCCGCQKWLLLDRFVKDSRRKLGILNLCRDCHTERRRVAKFGVSAEWHGQTLANQGGCCAICQSPTPRGRGWAIDHDHTCCPDKGTSCGECVRGILCSPCNLALGLFADRIDVLEAAAKYLADHASKQRMSIVRGV